MSGKSAGGDVQFGVGDVVRLTGAADKMTVAGLPDDPQVDQRVSVVWFDADGALHEAAFEPDALVLVKRGVDARLR